MSWDNANRIYIDLAADRESLGAPISAVGRRRALPVTTDCYVWARRCISCTNGWMTLPLRNALEPQGKDEILRQAERLERLASIVHQPELVSKLREQAAEYRRQLER